jgi:hypothetical protein
MRRYLAGAAAVFAALAVAATPALASHGGGGGGGGGGTTTPAGAPIATFSATSLDFGSLQVGTTSATQTVTITNTGTASLFINGVGIPQGSGDFDEAASPADCTAATIPVGGSCSIVVDFAPKVTGTRTGTISLLTTGSTGATVLNLTGVGVSAGGPTPISVNTPATGIPCVNGVCDTGLTTIVNDFYYTAFSAGGDTSATPLVWSLAAGTVPPGTTLKPDGTLIGFPTQTGTFTFTVRVTDATGRTATQAFSQTIVPVPAAGDPRCTHSPNEPGTLTGAAIGGKTPSGQATIDTSRFTACGGFYTITVSVKNVNLPNGSVLWATLSGLPIGEITLSGGAGSTKPFVYSGALRKQSIGVFSHVPPIGIFESAILGSGSLI